LSWQQLMGPSVHAEEFNGKRVSKLEAKRLRQVNHPAMK
jgi:hypothetical protein